MEARRRCIPGWAELLDPDLKSQRVCGAWSSVQRIGPQFEVCDEREGGGEGAQADLAWESWCYRTAEPTTEILVTPLEPPSSSPGIPV